MKLHLSLGVKVKNDELDARLLAQAIVLAKPHQIKVPVYGTDVEQIKELMSFYKFTSKQTAQLKGHLESLVAKAGDAFSIKELKKSIKDSKKREKRIIEQVHQLIQANPTYKKAYENITSMIGVGQIGGIALLHLFLKYPEANQRQITSLTGLNPIYRQSSSIFYRGALFMGVMSAMRYDENLGLPLEGIKHFMTD